MYSFQHSPRSPNRILAGYISVSLVYLMYFLSETRNYEDVLLKDVEYSLQFRSETKIS